MGYAKHTRSAIRIRTAPPTDPLRYPDLNRSANGCRGSWTANGCGGWVEPLQLFVGFGPVGPSRSAINSAPNSQLKTQHTNSKKSEGDPLSHGCRDSWTANGCGGWVEPLQLFVGFGSVGPSRSAINSALNSQLKTQHNTPTVRNLKEILSLSLKVTSKQEVGNQLLSFQSKWGFCNSVSKATSKKDSAKNSF